MKDFFLHNLVKRFKLPFLPQVAWAFDEGEARSSALMFQTEAWVDHIDKDGNLLERRHLGSGVITVVGVNAMVSDAVTGTSVVPLFARFKFLDSGTGSTAATDGDTALQTPITSGPTRVTMTLTNAQSATTGNHAAILQWQGTITYNTVGPTYPIVVTEFGSFDTAGSGNPVTGGNLWDRRVSGGFSANSGDSLVYTYQLTLPSNT